MRKTWGFKKKSDFLALSQISDATGLKRQHVHRALKKLEEMNVINVTKTGYNSANVVGINKDYDAWKNVTKNGYTSKKSSVTNMGTSVTKKGDINVTNMGTTINTIDNNNKKKYEALRDAVKKSDEPIVLIIKFFHLTMDEREQRRYLPATSNWKGKFEWLNTLKLLHHRDGYAYWEIFDVIYHARVKDDTPDRKGFCWRDNVLTIPGLRNRATDHKFDKIHKQIERDLHSPNGMSDLEYIVKEVERYAAQIG
jgi:DNA-binding transcriptional regulator GbsR (MarR family)